MELIQAIHQTGKPYVVVLMNGRPLTINWLAENSPAILETWFAGTQAGNAIADVLFGDTNPGGKLPVTFPRHAGQAPIYYNHKNTGRPATDQKYTSKYLDVPWTPLYPFGHGLSYTRFKYTGLRFGRQRIGAGESVEVSAEVENVGARGGEEVVELYVTDSAASVPVPVRSLQGVRRVFLKPGERRRVSFTLAPRQLSLIDDGGRRVVEPGEFMVSVGGKQPGFTGRADAQTTGVVTGRFVVTGKAAEIPER